MKFLVAIILSISLLTAESFATVSLHPPMVYAEKEDRSMAAAGATEEVADTDDFNPLLPLLYLARFYSALMLLGGITAIGVGISASADDSSSIGSPAGAILGGAGLSVLGGLCIYWSF
jgi:hypothetical protein